MSWERMPLYEGTAGMVGLLHNWWRQGGVEQPSVPTPIDHDARLDDKKMLFRIRQSHPTSTVTEGYPQLSSSPENGSLRAATPKGEICNA